MGKVSPGLRAARNLDFLIRNGGPDGNGTGPKTYVAISEASRTYAEEHGGPTISPNGVHKLHKGQTDNPTANALEAVGNAYGVKASYFLEDLDPAGAVGVEASPNGLAPDAKAVLTRVMLLVSLREHREADTQYADGELADLIHKHGGHLTDDEIKRLRCGEWQDHLRGPLAAFATANLIPPAFFFDEEIAARLTVQLKILSVLDDEGVQHVAMRLGVAGPEAATAFLPMIEHVISQRKK